MSRSTISIFTLVFALVAIVAFYGGLDALLSSPVLDNPLALAFIATVFLALASYYSFGHRGSAPVAARVVPVARPRQQAATANDDFSPEFKARFDLR